MPVVKFSADFDWKPKAAVTIAYKAGMQLLVTTPCAMAAVAAGKGTIITEPRRKPDGEKTQRR